VAAARADDPDFRVRVLAKDPQLRDESGDVIVTELRVPGGWLESGPRDHRFHVVDFDITMNEPPSAATPATATGRPDWSFEDLLADPFPADRLTGRRSMKRDAIHAQQVWAVAASTLAGFERALGRRVRWAFACPQLFLVPHAFPEANAYYDRKSRGVFFGYVPRRDATIYSCLSFDVVAHEVTHAILDGLRGRYLESTLPDGLAFHEA
jgi:hypothetical protein